MTDVYVNSTAVVLADSDATLKRGGVRNVIWVGLGSELEVMLSRKKKKHAESRQENLTGLGASLFGLFIRFFSML